MTNWKSASEPPPVNTQVLGYDRGGNMRVVELYKLDEEEPPQWQSCCSECWNLDGYITHWMKLPEEPK